MWKNKTGCAKSKKNRLLFVGAFLSLSVVVGVGYLFMADNSGRVALALTGDYSKSEGETLTSGEWNNLAADFLDKSGDTMSGTLDMGGNRITNLAATGASSPAGDAATKGYVDGRAVTAGGAATDVNGNPKKVICGGTAPGVGWIDYTAAGVHIGLYMNVDTRNGATPVFTDPGTEPPVRYFTSLGGNNNMDMATTGTTAIYIPSVSGFRIYIRTSYLPAQAQAEGWHINWCGVGD